MMDGTFFNVTFNSKHCALPRHIATMADLVSFKLSANHVSLSGTPSPQHQMGHNLNITNFHGGKSQGLGLV